jgi:hypothetical protein
MRVEDSTKFSTSVDFHDRGNSVEVGEPELIAANCLLLKGQKESSAVRPVMPSCRLMPRF